MDSAFSEKWYEMKMIRWKLKAILNIQILSTKKNWRTRIWLQKKISSIFHGTEISISSSTLKTSSTSSKIFLSKLDQTTNSSPKKSFINHHQSIIHPLSNSNHSNPSLSASSIIIDINLHSALCVRFKPAQTKNITQKNDALSLLLVVMSCYTRYSRYHAKHKIRRQRCTESIALANQIGITHFGNYMKNFYFVFIFSN